MRFTGPLVALAALTLTAAPAAAVPLSFDFDLALVSDYRDRGQSLSGGRPALQTGASARHASGAYAFAFASPVRGEGATLELQLGGGIERPLGFATLDLSVAAMIYPGARQLDMVELGARLWRGIGPAEAGLTLLYAPPQKSIGGRDNVYVAADASLPLARSPFSLRGSVGVEQGGVGPRKHDWSLGLAADLEGLILAVDRTDSDRGTPALVFSATRGF